MGRPAKLEPYLRRIATRRAPAPALNKPAALTDDGGS
jgi:hypothetical protein